MSIHAVDSIRTYIPSTISRTKSSSFGERDASPNTSFSGHQPQKLVLVFRKNMPSILNSEYRGTYDCPTTCA